MRVVVGIPCRSPGTITLALHRVLRRLDVEELPVEGKPVAETRNQIARRFLEGDGEILLSLDDDWLGSAAAVQELIGLVETRQADVAGAWALIPEPGRPGIPNVYDAAGQAWLAGLASGEPVELPQGGGMGAHALAIRREVLEKIRDDGELWWLDEFYPQGHEQAGLRSKGHDLRFCQLAQRLGFTVVVHAGLHAGHRVPVDLKVFWDREGAREAVASAAVHLAGALWGDSDWAAPHGFVLRAALEAASLARDQVCLEAGSGLTTAVLSRILGPARGKRGGRHLALEEDREWLEELGRRDEVAQDATLVAPITGPWYGVVGGLVVLKDLLAGRRVGLWVIDGPRGDGPGRRDAVVPFLETFSAPGAVALVDDLQRGDGRHLVGLVSGLGWEVHEIREGTRAWAVARCP